MQKDMRVQSIKPSWRTSDSPHDKENGGEKLQEGGFLGGGAAGSILVVHVTVADVVQQDLRVL